MACTGADCLEKAGVRRMKRAGCALRFEVALRLSARFFRMTIDGSEWIVRDCLFKKSHVWALQLKLGLVIEVTGTSKWFWDWNWSLHFWQRNLDSTHASASLTSRATWFPLWDLASAFRMLDIISGLDIGDVNTGSPILSWAELVKQCIISFPSRPHDFTLLCLKVN